MSARKRKATRGRSVKMSEVFLTANAVADQIAELAKRARPHSLEVIQMVFMLISQRLNEAEPGAALQAASGCMTFAGGTEPPPVPPPT